MIKAENVRARADIAELIRLLVANTGTPADKFWTLAEVAFTAGALEQAEDLMRSWKP